MAAKFGYYCIDRQNISGVENIADVENVLNVAQIDKYIIFCAINICIHHPK